MMTQIEPPVSYKREMRKVLKKRTNVVKKFKAFLATQDLKFIA